MQVASSALDGDSLPERIEPALAKAEFSDVWGTRLESSVVKHLYETNQRCPLPSADAISVPQHELQRLVSTLDASLGIYKSPSSGAVGNGLYLLTGSLASPRLPSVADYAKILVLAALRIGPERVARLFSGWLQGKPMRLHQCALLKGISTAESLRPVNGLNLETLPPNGADFPRSLRIDMFDVRQEQFSHRAMLGIEYEIASPLYDPETFRENPLQAGPRPTLVNPELSSVSVEAFCRAMSLQANNHVDWFLQWSDYGDTEAFFLNPGFSSARKEAPNTPAVLVSRDDVRECLDTHAHLEAFSKLYLAIARWRRSKRSTSAHEQLVELRIALESVLLSDDQGSVGEKRHRVAIRGAWLLGSTFDERKRHFDTLRVLYDYASSVIHAGTPKEKKSAPVDTTISDAQHLCRQAILQIARARAMPSWTDVVLDRGPDDGTQGNTPSK